MENEHRMNGRFLSFWAVLFFVVPIFFFGLTSIFDIDPTVSTQENRTLKTMPEFTVESLLNGDFTKGFDEYYSDTFPFRGGFIKISNSISKILTQHDGKDNIVIINRQGTEEAGGEALKNN